MITKSDVLLLLTELQDNGEDVGEDIKNLYSQPIIPMETLKKINGYKPLDLVNFYNKLRVSYNKKKSKLYINIMKSDENATVDAKSILTTLSGLLNQILQYECEDKTAFLRSVRSDEIIEVLKIYFSTFNISPAYKLLKLFKADIYASEYINDRRH